MISHSDYCPVDNTGDLEDCTTCMAEQERQQAYYGALYAREYHATEADIRDAYSDPTDHSKRDILLSRLGYE